jgi:hypothetical protein
MIEPVSLVDSATISSGLVPEPFSDKLLLDARGLAHALSIPVATVRQYSSKHPEKLPPRLNHEGRKLLWAVEDVKAWVQAQRPHVNAR